MRRRFRRVVEQLESRTLFAGTTFSFAAEDHVAVEASWQAPSGGDIVVVTIVRSGDVSASGTQTVWLDTPEADGTATAGVDFQPVRMQPVTFTAGARATTVAIDVLPDFEAESDETIALRLHAEENPPAGAAPLSSSAITIYDDDNNQPSTVRFAASGFAGAEHPFFGPSTPVGLVRTGNANEFTTASLAVHTIAAASGVTPATGIDDFMPSGTTVFFNPGDTVQWVPIPVASDGLPEADEAVGLTLAPGDTVPDPGAGETRVYSILDVDGGSAAPRVSIAGASIVEGDSGSSAGDLALTLTLSEPLDALVSVQVASLYPTVPVPAGTAEPGADYQPFNAFVAFMPGETTVTVTLPGVIVGDDLPEPDETFGVALSSPSSGVLVEDGFATVTILDDEPRLSIGDAEVVEGSNFGQPWPEMRFPVTLQQPSDQPVGVWVRTIVGAGDTAATDDYQGGVAFVTFDPGATQAEFLVPIRPDHYFEDDEAFTAELFDPQGATLADGTAVGKILDDEAPLVFVDDVDVAEGSGGVQRTVDVTVRLARPVSQYFNVLVQSTPDTADSNDFLPNQTLVEFQPGTTSQVVPVLVNPDLNAESDESFNVELSSSFSFVRFGDDAATVTLRDDDRGGQFRLTSVQPTTLNEGDQTGVISIARDIATEAASVRYTLVPGTAGADDFGRLSDTPGALTGIAEFAVGQAFVRLGRLPILDDDLDEPDESFTIVLSDPSEGASLLSGFTSRTITIVDTDPTLSNLSVNDVSVVETAGGTFADFTVSLSGALWQGSPAFVNFQTANDTAAAADDYQFTSGQLSFVSGGPTTQTVRVPVLDDNVYEPGAAERFLLQLSNPINAKLADGEGAATIADDDPMFGWFEFLPASTSVAEDGGSAGVSLSFTPTVPAPGVVVDRPTSLSVAWTTSSGVPGFDAIPSYDYEHTGGTIQFSPDIAGGAFVSAPILNDITPESDKRFKFWLHEAAPAGTAYRTDIAPVTILDDDRGGEFTIFGQNLRTEGQAATFNVTRSHGQEAAEVDVVTVDGTAAAAGGDYAAVSQRLTFAVGETSKFITVNTTADGANVEADEQFTVELRNPGPNANISTTFFSGSATIQETYFNGLIRLIPESPAAGVVEGQPFNFRVERVGRADFGVTIDLQRVSGTAFPFSDYDNPPFMSLAAGEFSKSFSINTLTDRTDDGDKTARLGFTPFGVPGALVDTSAATFDMNILNADAAPKIEVGDITIVEGTGGTVTAMVPVRMYGSRPRGTPSSVQIGYSVVPGTATPLDAYSVSGGVGFFLGNYDPDVGVTAYAQVGINPDAIDEGDETFTVELTSQVFPPGTPLEIVDGSATVTILDDDSAPRIASVFVSGSGWTQNFRNHLAATGQGDATHGFAIDPAAAPDELPWTNLDRVSVRFDKPIQEIRMEALTLRGLNVPTYAASGFTYDFATNTATWSFATPFAVDRLQATLAHVIDNAGNPMTTANGTFYLDVLPGDVNRSGGSVIGSDVTNVRNAQNSPPGGAGSLYTIFKDVNGSGTIVGSDVTAVRNRQGFRLPTGAFVSTSETASSSTSVTRASELLDDIS